MPSEAAAGPTGLEEAAAAFSQLRPRLFGIAYRMLGSAVEAEDVVQDVWLRWQDYDRSTVTHAEAFLITMTTRMSINVTRSARRRRETYVGPWLPEPVDTSSDPALGAIRGEALELAVLLLLERLSPTERAAYVLREAFDYPYENIAEILELSQANVRQLVSRARKHLAAERRTTATRAERRRLLGAFMKAAQGGDLTALESIFAADVASLSDGGGVVRASRIPVLGRTRVAKFIKAFSTRFWTETTSTEVTVNGEPAIFVTRHEQPVVLVSITSTDEGIDQILWVMNPDKLARVRPQR